MLREYSKINYPIQAVRLGRIVRWKGEGKSLYYVNEISVDSGLTITCYPHAKEKAATLLSRFLRIPPFTTL